LLNTKDALSIIIIEDKYHCNVKGQKWAPHIPRTQPYLHPKIMEQRNQQSYFFFFFEEEKDNDASNLSLL
jgi:hypothetical protein